MNTFTIPDLYHKSKGSRILALHLHKTEHNNGDF